MSIVYIDQQFEELKAEWYVLSLYEEKPLHRFVRQCGLEYHSPCYYIDELKK